MHQRTALFLSLLATTNLALANDYDALFKAKKYAEIDKATSAKLAQDPKHADSLIARAMLILAEGRETQIDEALSLTERCVEAHPKNSECHESLGNVYANKVSSGGMLTGMKYAGKIRDAYAKAVELDAQNYSARNSLLQFYLIAPSIAGGGRDKAQTLVAETQKTNALAGNLLQAQLELKDEKYTQAEKLLLSVKQGESDSLDKLLRGTMYALGNQYLNDKKFEDAERIYTHLAQRFPDRFMGNFGLGRVKQEQGKSQEALGLLEKALHQDSQAGIYYRLAQCWASLNDKNKAIEFFEKAIQFKPELSKKLRSDALEQLKILKK